MAGIGFEHRKLLAKDSLSGPLKACAYDGVIGSAPGCRRSGLLVIGLASALVVVPGLHVLNAFTLRLGAPWQGCGYAAAVRAAPGRFVLDRRLWRVEYKILMRQ